MATAIRLAARREGAAVGAVSASIEEPARLVVPIDAFALQIFDVDAQRRAAAGLSDDPRLDHHRARRTAHAPQRVETGRPSPAEHARPAGSTRARAAGLPRGRKHLADGAPGIAAATVTDAARPGPELALLGHGARR